MKSKNMGSRLTDAMPKSDEDMDEPMDPMNDHETRGHLNTLMDAEHIKADPMKMKKVHALAGRHEKALAGIKGFDKAPMLSTNDLRSYRNKKAME